MREKFRTKIFFSYIEILLFASFMWLILGMCTTGIYVDKKRKKVVVKDCPTIDSCQSDRDTAQFNCIMLSILLAKVPPKGQTLTPEEKAMYDKQNQDLLPLRILCEEDAKKKDTSP